MSISETLQSWENHYQPLQAEIRPSNEPEIKHHNQETENGIVLIHGLTDSPFLVKAIGQKFHENGFNVVIPLLPGHGLKQPEEKMESVQLEEWLEEVEFAVQCAGQISQKVSIGGLSLGGALSTYKAIAEPDKITGALFIFAAALDIGDPIEYVLRVDPLIKLISLIQGGTKKRPWGIGDSPYRYSQMSANGASQLSRLIERISDRYAGKDKSEKYSDIKQPVFVAHSEVDKAASIEEVELLVNNHPQVNDKTKFFRIQKRYNLSHASIVLQDNIVVQGKVLELANPLFNEMMRHVQEFSQKHLTNS